MAWIPPPLAFLMSEAHFCSEDALGLGPVEQRSQSRHGLHYLDAVLLLREALVHFQERDDTLHVPEIIRGRLSADVPIHRSLEEDRGENPVAVKAGAGDDARAHLMHERKHLFLVGPCAFLDSVAAQRLGCAATTLVQRGKEAGLRLDFPLLLFLQAIHNVSVVFRCAGSGCFQNFRSSFTLPQAWNMLARFVVRGILSCSWADGGVCRRGRRRVNA